MVATSRFGNMKNTRCQLVLAVVEWWLVGNLNTVVSHERRFIKLLQIMKNNCIQTGYVCYVRRHAPVFHSKRSSVCYF